MNWQQIFRRVIAAFAIVLAVQPAEKPALVYMAGAGEKGGSVEEQRHLLEELFPEFTIIIPSKRTEKYDPEITATYLNSMGGADVLVGFSQGAIGACRVYALLDRKPVEVWLLGASAGVTDRQAYLYAEAVSTKTSTHIIMGKNEPPERQARGKKNAEIMGASFSNPKYIGHDAAKLLRQMFLLRRGEK